MSADQIPLSVLAVTSVSSVRLTDTARRAGALMDELNVAQLPVLEPGKRLCGVVTWRRLSLERRDWHEIQVSEIVQEMPADQVRHPDTTLG